MGERASQPDRRRAPIRVDRLGGGIETDLVHRIRLRGHRQGHERAEQVSGPEKLGKLAAALFQRPPRRFHADAVPAGGARVLGRPREQSRAPAYGGQDDRHGPRPCLGLGCAPFPVVPEKTGRLGGLGELRKGPLAERAGVEPLARLGRVRDLHALRRHAFRRLAALWSGARLHGRSGDRRAHGASAAHAGLRVRGGGARGGAGVLHAQGHA